MIQYLQFTNIALSTLKKFLLAILLFPIPGQYLLAETSLQVANAFNIKAVNGAKYEAGFFTQSRKLQLNPGVNLVALEFEMVFDGEDDDSFDIVKSHLFLLKVYLKADSHYQQRFVKPQNAEAARRYLQNPIFEVVTLNQSGQITEKAAFEFISLATHDLSIAVEKTKVRPNATLKLYHPQAEKDKILSLSTTQQNRANSNLDQSNALKMLDYWWQKATPEERKAFLESVK